MPTVNNRGLFLGGSACGSSPGGAMKPGSNLHIAGLRLSAGCVSQCASPWGSH